MSIIKFISDNINRAIVYLFLVFWVLIIVYLTTRRGYVMGMAVSLLPLILIYIWTIIKNPYIGFFVLLVLNYFIMGLVRYVNIPSPGIMMDLVIILTFVSIIINSFDSKTEIKFKNALNGLTLVAAIWVIFCIFQIFNPHSSSILAWLTSVRGIGVYFLAIVVLTSILMRKYRDLKRFLFIWAILSLIAVLKAFIQKTFGFDKAELIWLYVGGGSTTHIISSGIRYFSFYTDAANFGTGIAFSGVVFAISSFYFKQIRMKLFYLLVAAACAYGMLISGTRGSLAVPFVAFTAFVILSKRLKTIVITSILVASSFIFLKYTYYGQGNSYVRRARSAFNTEDASYQVRLNNQKKLKTFMSDKPFGVGLGMSKGDATNYRPIAYLTNIPSDSWYVLIWMENGIVGLILHILILSYILIYGSVTVLFRLKNRELRGFITAMLCGLAGVFVASYTIEIMGQFPSGFIIFISMTFIFLSPVFDKELKEAEINKSKAYETLS